MALSDKWTRAQLRTAVRDEILDPSAKWWTDTELNDYISSWQNRLQEEFDFVWGTATKSVGIGTATVTVTSLATDVQRVDSVWWNGIRMYPKLVEEMYALDKDWLNAGQGLPEVAYQRDSTTVSVWPTPSAAGTLGILYPKILTFSTDTSTMSIPAWTRYSVIPYAASRCFARLGPNQDTQKAMRYRKEFDDQRATIRDIYSRFFAQKFLHLRPASEYEKKILNPITKRIVVSG